MLVAIHAEKFIAEVVSAKLAAFAAGFIRFKTRRSAHGERSTPLTGEATRDRINVARTKLNSLRILCLFAATPSIFKSVEPR